MQSILKKWTPQKFTIANFWQPVSKSLYEIYQTLCAWSNDQSKEFLLFGIEGTQSFDTCFASSLISMTYTGKSSRARTAP